MKIVVPIIPKNLEEIEAIDRERLSEADIVEWRADFLPKAEILKVAPAVFEVCKMVKRYYLRFEPHVRVDT